LNISEPEFSGFHCKVPRSLNWTTKTEKEEKEKNLPGHILRTWRKKVGPRRKREKGKVKEEETAR